uniref:Chemokine (C-X-C motif) receptor 2 n=1 Tax=Oryzias latipes TaxID=8090 RepID=A0A3P9J5A3_ORYLA
MRLYLYILSLLYLLMLSSQDMGDKATQLTLEEADSYFDLTLFNDSYNFTYSDETVTDDSLPCNVTVPGFNSVALMVVYILVSLFSLIGNSLVVFVVCTMKKGRGSTDIYLMHLAIADLLFCITLPFWGTYVHFGWSYGNFLCKVLSGFQEASVYSGVFLLACISVDRFFAVVRATRVLSSNHHLVKVVCSVVWLMAGLLSLPVVIKRESMFAEELNQSICYENVTGESSDLWQFSLRILRHTLGFFLPLVVMTFCYGRTGVTLLQIRNQQKQKAMRVIMAVVLGFVLCWLPYNVAVLTDTLIRAESLKVTSCDTRYRVEVTLNVTQILAYMHCAINPVLYAFIGQKFRNQLLLSLYKHGVISKRIQMAYRKGSAHSWGSIRSKNTSVTM